MKTGRRRLLTAALVVVVGGLVVFVGQGMVRLYWHERQARSIGTEMARQVGLDEADRPFWVVDELAKRGASYQQVAQDLVSLESFVEQRRWYADSTRVVEEVRFGVPWSFDEVVYLEYRAGTLSNVEGGDYPLMGLERISEEGAAERLEDTSAGG